MRSRSTSRFTALLGAVLAVALAVSAVAAPSGPPIRIGGTLALTGPLAATALLHKITAEIYIEELNRGHGLLGRPVEWVLLDDQSKPEITRTLYEKLITVDKVDLLMAPTRQARSSPRWAWPSAIRRCSFTIASACRISRSTRCTSRRRPSGPSRAARCRAWSSTQWPRP